MRDSQEVGTSSPENPMSGDRTAELEAEILRLRRAQHRYKTIVESAQDFAILTMDREGLITSWSPGAGMVLGWSEAEAIGRHASMIFTPEDQAHDQCGVEFANAEADQRAEDERWHLRKDGSRFWASGLMMLLEDEESGQHIGYLKMLRDRTPQHEAETRLRESATFAQALLESSADCLKVLDLQGRLVSMNGPGLCVMEIEDFAPLKGQDWATLWPDALQPNLRDALEAARQGAVGRFYGPCPTAKGTLKWWDVQVSPVPDADGQPQMLLAVSRDATDRTRSHQAIQESELRFRNMADHAPVMMWITDPSGAATYLNKRWYEFTGQSPEEAAGLGWLDAVHPDDRVWSGETFLAANKNHEPFRLEYRLRDVEGAYHWAIDAASPRFGPEGQFLGYIGSVIDIDERRRTEDALRRANDLLAAVMEAVPGVVYAKDREGRILAANRGTEELVGKPMSEILGRTDREFLDDAAQAEVVMANDRRVMAGDRAEVLEEEVSFPDGARAVWLSTKAPFRGADGTVIGLVGSSLDVTELKSAQEALGKLNESLEAQVAERTADRDRIWRLSTDLMLVALFDSTITAVNPAWTSLLGWPSEALIGRPFLELVHPEDVEATLAEAGKLSEGRTTIRFVNRYQHKDGSFRWLSWTAVPDENFIHAVARDVTAEHEAADTLQKIEEQLRQAQKMEAVGQLTGGLAHDFNNLLAGISGSLELMQTRISQGRLAEVERYIAAAQGAARRAAALTHRLLAFSRRQTLDPRATNVDQLVSGMEDLIRRTIGPLNELEVVGTAGLWPALVDPPQLETALLNLCINARDAMPDGGRITIETANKWIDEHAALKHDLSPGQYLSICVTDTGTGMTPDIITKAFDPFFTTKPIGEGTGLGLSMIYGFAKQSGGQVRIYSEVGTGTTVCIYLPRHYGEAEAEEETRASAAAERALEGETVLVVDDEPTVRMLVTDVLEDLGYRAIEAGDSIAGLKVLQSDAKVDLLITDVGLPGGMNGRQMADAARVSRPDLRVLFITGYAENAVIGNGQLEAGMAILTKPFPVDVLAVRIRDMLERKYSS